MPTQEVAPGIYRIESTLGPRPFAQYLLRGERSLLVDTGVATTPDEVILPALADLGLDPADLDFVLNSHADVDHFGGNARLRVAAPRALFCAHAADVPWIEDAKRIMRERYGWYADHGPTVDYGEEVKGWLRAAMGEDVPVDLELSGGERFRLGPDLSVEVLHLPGHSAGHLGLWEPLSRSAIVTDAVLAGGLLDHDGRVIHPPPYMDVPTYGATIDRLRDLDPARLLTAHYAVIEGVAVERFLDESAGFVTRARQAVAAALAEAGEATLADLLPPLSERLGPFSSIPNELAGPVRAHLREMVAGGRAEEVVGRRPMVWRVVG